MMIASTLKGLVRLLFVAFMALSAAYHAGAQHVTAANGEGGGRQVSGDFGSSKFSEYRDLPAGVLFNAFSLGFMNDETTRVVSMWGTNIAQRDQGFIGLLRQGGQFKIQAAWDQIPHNYTNMARTIYNPTSSGVLEIPPSVRNKLRTILATDINSIVRGIQYDTAALVGLVDGMARSVEVKSQRDKWKALVKYAPVDELQFKFDYSNERRSGYRRSAGVFRYHAPSEVLEPTDYLTQQGSARAEYAAKDWNAQLGYAVSLFRNNVDVLTLDNPFLERDSIVGASRARLALSPSNRSQQLSLAGSVNLPFSTRIRTTLAYDIREQDARFIPLTINAAVETLSTFPALPAQSLKGRTALTLLNVFLTQRFFPAAWFSARYRSFDYDSRTSSMLFSGYFDPDNLLALNQRATLPIGYRKVNLVTELLIRPLAGVSLGAGYERENWKRRSREAIESHEDIYKVSFDYTKYSWMVLRTSYSFGTKGSGDFDYQRVELESFPAGRQLPRVGQLSSLRRFDLANRNRNRATIMGQLIPTQDVTMTGSFSLIRDNFTDSEYGMLWNRSHSLSWDITFSPSYDFGIRASFTRENFQYAMRSRQREIGTDTSNNDWSSNMQDVIHTYGVALNWAIVPDEIDVSVGFTFSDATGSTGTQAPGNPALRGFPKTAQDYPDTRSIVRQAIAAVRYRLMDHFTPRLEYRFEGYSESYFNQDIMTSSMIAVDPVEPKAVYLGIRQPGFAAHLISLALTYDF